ncbi:MAG: hypothetical protein ABIF08_03595 [Nanoarchaeota archaeon]
MGLYKKYVMNNYIKLEDFLEENGRQAFKDRMVYKPNGEGFVAVGAIRDCITICNKIFYIDFKDADEVVNEKNLNNYFIGV